jgi:hypothetical protein
MMNYKCFMHAYLKDNALLMAGVLLMETYIHGIEHLHWMAITVVVVFTAIGSIAYLLK